MFPLRMKSLSLCRQMHREIALVKKEMSYRTAY